MKRLLLLASILMGLGISYSASAQDAPFVHCLVLDNTLSMKGHGGEDIWDDVQNYCYGWVDGVSAPSIVVLYTFAKEVSKPKEFKIDSDADKEKVKNAIKEVVVNGRYTWICSNLKQVKDAIYAKYTQNNKMIYLITDGIEEEPGKRPADFIRVLQEYGSQRGDYDHLYYIDINDKAAPEIKQAIEENPNVTITDELTHLITLSPLFTELNFVIGSSTKFEQIFKVSGGNVDPRLSFDVKVDSLSVVGETAATPNLTVTPATVTISNMKDVDGQYMIEFNLNFINNSACECDIYVSLNGKSLDNNQLTFSPAGFCIKARNKVKPVIKFKGGIGWH